MIRTREERREWGLEGVFWSVVWWSLGFTVFVGLWLFGGGKPEWAYPFMLGSLLVLGDLMVMVKGIEILLGQGPERLKKWVRVGMVGKYLVLVALIYQLARAGMNQKWSMVWLAGGVSVFPLMTALKAAGIIWFARGQKAAR
ncbi:MAG: hypothetical protein V2G42_06050 [bacterium JZ-2024 1]